MVLNFVGDVDSVRERQKEFISEVLEKRGYKNCDVVIEEMGTAGDNFMANVKRIVVNQDGKTFKMVAKLAPVFRDMIDAGILFRNEHYVYTEVFPKFRELQENAGIPETDWFRHAECYGTFIEAPDEVILLEDLKEPNFAILNRFEPMSIECVKLVLKNFAILHSLSFVLKHQEPETFRELKSKLADVYDYDMPPEMMKIKLQFGQQIEDNVLRNLSEERYKPVFQGTMGKILDLNRDLVEDVKDSQYSVIQQGDGWTNNIMFTFEDDRPSKCVLIDYQMAKESHPMYDVTYMLFNSTAADLRVKHYTEFIDCYYNELDKSLNNFGIKAKHIYPREQLDIDVKKCIKIILAISIIIANLIVKDVEEASKLQETMKTTSDIFNSDEMMNAMLGNNANILFKNRLDGLARSVIELGLLESD